MVRILLLLVLATEFAPVTRASTLGEWCGARRHGDLNKLIPDSFRPQDVGLAIALCGWIPGGPAANFRPACYEHDSCYWTLGVDRKQCDSRFRDHLESVCRATYHAAHRKRHESCCIKAAYYYETAVENMGGDSYRSAQEEAQYAAEHYEKLSGDKPDQKTRERIAELCMSSHDSSGRCHVEHVVEKLLESFSSE